MLFADAEGDRPDPVPRFDADGLPIPDSRLELRLGAHRLGVVAGLGGEIEPTPGVLLFAALDTGLIALPAATEPPSTRGFVDEARATGLVRALGLEVFADDGRRWSLLLGKQRMVLGGGLLVDTPALGADVAFEDDHLGLRLGLWWPGRDIQPAGWPILRAAVEWRPDLFVQLRLFVASTRFGGSRGKALVRPAVQAGVLDAARRVVDAWLGQSTRAPPVPPLHASPQLADGDAAIERLLECADFDALITPWWLGGEVEALLDGHTLGATVIVGGGAGQVTPEVDPACPRFAELSEALIPPRRFALRSAGLDARWRMRLADPLYVGAFAVAMSGHPPGRGLARLETFGALIAPAPLATRPSLLFDGGLGADLGERPAVAYGYDGRGALGGGPTALLVPHPTVEIDLMAAPLWTATGADDRRFYGWELDGALRWQPGEQWVIRARGAALWPGAFFAGGGPWWRAALTVEGRLR